MRILRVKENVTSYQTLVPVDLGVWSSDALFFEGKAKTAWEPPEVVVLNPLKKRGNFFYLIPGALVFDEEALESLRDLLEMAGQILELPLGNETLYILNVLECINALDSDRSVWNIDPQSSQRLSLKQYAFRRGFVLESTLFKIPETVRGEVLVYSDLKDRGDEFMYRYLDSGLTGLEFQELWVDQT